MSNAIAECKCTEKKEKIAKRECKPNTQPVPLSTKQWPSNTVQSNSAYTHRLKACIN